MKLLSESQGESHWHFIKTLPDDKLITIINKTVIEEIESKYGGNVFSPISIQNPKTLRKIIEKIDPLVLSTIDSDVKGDAFEYFLQRTTSTNNDLGEYFTPRHIVKTVVNLIAPRFKEKVYDPFCGTGGFLTEVFNYIKENHVIDEDDLERLQHGTLYGSEITTTARIAKMNMILHGDGHSGVKQIDSLVHPVDGAYDVVITNIPFSQKTTSSSLYYNGLAKNNGDATCILHCLRALKKGGRMALIVPEGFLFRKHLAPVRAFLLSKTKLEIVISLPRGTFLPYTGVKTDILYFTHAHQANHQQSYWYFDVKDDGYSLDNRRRPLPGKNDLHKVAESDVKKAAKDPSLISTLLQAGFERIALDAIKQHDYNLLGKTYRNVDKGKQSETAQLGDILDIRCGERITSKHHIGTKYPVFGGGDASFRTDHYNCQDSLVIARFAMSKECVRYVKGRFWLLDSGFTVSIKKNKHDTITPAYVNALLLHMQEPIYHCGRGAAQRNIGFEKFKAITIPLPSLARQQEIVDELKRYQRIIDGLQQVIKSYQPTIIRKESWKVISLGQLCTRFEYGYTGQPIHNGNARYIRITDIQEDGNLGDHPVFVTLDAKSKPYLLDKGDVVVARIGSVGKSYLHQGDQPAIFASYLIRLHFDKEAVLPQYLRYCFNGGYYWQQVKALAAGAVQPQFNAPTLRRVKIPLPPRHVQQEIIAQLDTERKMVAAQKDLVALFQRKIQDTLHNLWQP